MLPVVVVLLVLIGGGSFYGGMKYADSKRAASFAATRNSGGFRNATGTFGGGRGAAAGRGGMGGFATGEIISKDNNSVTIKLRDGGSQIAFFSSSTQVMKSATGSVDDLKAGENVMIAGSANSDGSVTAQNIQLRPAMATSSAK